MLNDYGINTINHAYPDHGLITEQDLDFQDGLPVLITEKDAVKFLNINLPNIWVVKIKTKLEAAFFAELLDKIKRVRWNKNYWKF